MPEKTQMTGVRMRQIRDALKLSRPNVGKALGYTGKVSSLETQIMRFENSHRTIPIGAARLMIMYEAYGIPERFMK